MDSTVIKISYHSGGMVDKPLKWVIRHLTEVGYNGIEIVCGPYAHIRPDEVTERQLEELKALLEQYRMKVAAINPYTVPALPTMAKEDRVKAITFYHRLIDIAVTLGAPTVNFLTGWFPEGDAQGWRILIETLKPLLHYAGERGVCMSVHNHEGTVIDSPDKVALLIETVRLPNLKSLFDATNFYILGSDIGWAVQRLAPHIIHCHLKGVVGKYPFHHFLVPCEPGDQFPLSEFVSSLSKAGYDAYVSVETFLWMREDKAKVAYQTIKSRISDYQG